MCCYEVTIRKLRRILKAMFEKLFLIDINHDSEIEALKKSLEMLLIIAIISFIGKCWGAKSIQENPHLVIIDIASY